MISVVTAYISDFELSVVTIKMKITAEQMNFSRLCNVQHKQMVEEYVERPFYCSLDVKATVMRF